MITLFKKNAKDIGRWSIWSEGNVIKISHSSTIDGKAIMHKEVVPEGKQTRTLDEQVQHRIASRVSKQRDKGYKNTIDEAMKSNNNTLGLTQPMLAQSYKPEKHVFMGELYIQPKLNGHRCLIAKKDGEVIAYSRQGKVIDTVDHITEQLADSIPDGMTLDGELFLPGAPLQQISSYVKRKQEKTEELEYHVFDVLTEKNLSSFEDRTMWLKGRIEESDTVKFVPTHLVIVNHDDKIHSLFSLYVSQGYEGIMVRTAKGKYKPGGRPRDLMKVKPVFDAEVEVIDIEEGANQIGVCVCRWSNCAESFKITAPGDMSQKMIALKSKDKYVGRRMKIEYRELTNDGKPFHAAATEWFSAI
ncbi:MAG: hypothetical protein LC687_01085 [Actinobacteria bacterium]|nr:hypothetical protein [Actinomycetota bacterium]